MERKPCGEALEGQLQEQRRDDRRAHAGHVAAEDRPCGTEQRFETHLPRFCSNCRGLAQPKGVCDRHGGNRGRGQKECRLHAQQVAKHQEDDGAGAHLKGHAADGERPIARGDHVRDEGLKWRPLQVEACIEQDDRSDQAGDPHRACSRQKRSAGCREREPGDDDVASAAASCYRPVRERAGPGHEQKQENVVDGHDRADGRAALAQLVLDQQRQIVSDKRTGCPGDEAAEAQEGAQ